MFLPQLNINPMKERELGLGNRNRELIGGVFLRKKADPEGKFCFDKAQNTAILPGETQWNRKPILFYEKRRIY